MTLGVVLGYLIGKGMVFLINTLLLEYEGLYPVLTFALVLLIYGTTALLDGNGFLAVYVAGITMGNSTFMHKKSLVRFHDGLAWLMQTSMFLTLGLLVFPSHLVPVVGLGLLISVFLMLVARPLGVFLTLYFFKFSFKEKLMLSWVGLRGAAPIILATFPLLSGIPNADMIFNVVFFVVLTSALIQGTSIPLVARWLGVDTLFAPKTKYPMEFEPVHGFLSDMVELGIPEGSSLEGKRIVEVNFPKHTLVLLIRRGEEFIIPSGETLLKAGDTMLVLAHKEAIPKLHALVG
jgi:cell volume regulation protein A